MKIQTRIALFTLVGVALMSAAVAFAWHRVDGKLRAKQRELVETQAVAIGENTARQVAATRAMYAKHLVGELKPHGVEFTQHPGSGQAPLPAVFIGKISQKLLQDSNDASVSFVLRSGWNINPRQGIDEGFEQRGWEHLLAQQESRGPIKSGEYTPYWERVADEDGTPVIRVMTADLASARSCVSCHNALEQTEDILAMRGNATPKTFQLGDLMGAVVTTVPISGSESLVAELTAAQDDVGRWIWGGVLLGVLGCVGCGIYVGRQISRRVAAVANRLTDIDLAERLDSVGGDEVSELAGSFNGFAERLHQLVLRVKRNADAIVGATGELDATATSLESEATAATGRSRTVSAAAEQLTVTMGGVAQSTQDVSANVQSVSDAVKELHAMALEIAAGAEQSARVANQASEFVAESTNTINELNSSALEIGSVSAVIQDIAEQTNLLALNATIESARAGEAGKGFAVVATEVKELAKQTSDATEGIRSRIEGIQASSVSTAKAIEKFGGVIEEVNHLAQKIAGAVEAQAKASEQTVKRISQTAEATECVARGSEESAAASQEITENIIQVDGVLKQTVTSASKSRESQQHVGLLAVELQGLASEFNKSGDSNQEAHAVSI